MTRNEIKTLPEYFERYINLVDNEIDLFEAFEKSIQKLNNLDLNRI